MKRTAYILSALLALATWSCKTTEENYRNAYEIAKAQKQAAEADDVDAELNNRNQPKPMEISGVELPVRTELVVVQKEAGGEVDDFATYNVVVAEFKQIFNAKSMRQRLESSGYPGALVVRNRNDLYYVVAGSTRDIKVAAALLDKVKADKGIALKAPYPYVLRAGQFVR